MNDHKYVKRELNGMNRVLEITKMVQQTVPKNWFDALRTRHGVTAWLFGQRCLLCDVQQRTQAGAYVTCSECFEDFLTPHNRCWVCGIPLPATIEDTICGQCLVGSMTQPRRQHNHTLSGIFVVGDYLPPLSTLIQIAKYQGRLDVLADLTQLFAEFVNTALAQHRLEQPDCLVPVPLHPNKLRMRGFNQACQIALGIGRHCSLRVETRLVRRVTDTSAQSLSTEQGRQRNVRGAFAVTWEKLPDLSIAIIDDVYTTGSTSSELARCLINAGARQVELWTLARVPIGEKRPALTPNQA